MEPWHILITLGIAAFIAEIFTAAFISGSIGIGLFFAAVGNYFGLEAKWQIVLFAVGVALTYFLIRPVVNKYGYRKDRIKTNQDALIDKRGTVSEEINHLKGTGRISIDGDIWQAKSKEDEIIEVGAAVKVVAIDSIILFVETLK